MASFSAVRPDRAEAGSLRIEVADEQLGEPHFDQAAGAVDAGGGGDVPAPETDVDSAGG